MDPKRYSHLLCSVPRSVVEHERDIYEFEKELNRRFRYRIRVERNYHSQEYDIFVRPDDPYFSSRPPDCMETMRFPHSNWSVLLKTPFSGLRVNRPEPEFFYESMEDIKAKAKKEEARIARKNVPNPLLLLL